MVPPPVTRATLPFTSKRLLSWKSALLDSILRDEVVWMGLLCVLVSLY